MSELAKKIIYENKKERKTAIDLGMCSLNEIPEELFSCIWLEKLVLSNGWNTKSGRYEHNMNNGEINTINQLPEKLKELKNLKVLVLGGEPGNRWKIKDVSILNELTSLKHLDLNYNQIYDISSLANLCNLEFLDLHTNNISNFDILSKFQHLKYLDIGDNTEPDLKSLYNLHNIEYLDISKNWISNINFIKNYKNIHTLNVSENAVRNVTLLENLPKLKSAFLYNTPVTNISFSKELTNLEVLDLAYTGISEISFLKKTPNLKSLSLWHNEVTDISNLSHLKKLESLNLSNNKISDFTPLTNLKNLINLDLRGTGEIRSKIRDFSFLRQFTKLQNLEIAANNINDITFLNYLPHLQSLELEYNELSTVESLFPLLNLKGGLILGLRGNPVLEQFPREVLEVGWSALKDRLISIQNGEKFIVLDEIKALLLGNTNVGKSNLLEYFSTGREPEGTSSTHGIQYKALKTLIPGITVNCWDFGGQDYFHATHQLFFGPGALNILMWSQEDIPREELHAFFDLKYWLRSIEHIINQNSGRFYSKNEVVLCENKIDLHGYNPKNLNQSDFQNEFPTLNLSFSFINLKPLLPDLLTGFKGHLALRSKGLLSEHSYRYGQYLQIIRQSSKPFLEINDISPDFPEIINTAIPVFQKIGILLYFPDIIPNKIFNKPQILLDLLYIKVLSPELLRKRKFTITRIQITKSIKGNQLNLNTKELIRLLDFYNLVFRIPNNRDVFYIPQYMQEPSIENKRLIKDAYQINNIIIKSDHFLMNLAMLKLYSQFGKYAELDLNSNYLFWKDAIIIEKNRQKLFIRFNRDNERIELYPWNKGENFDLQNEVVQFIINSRRRIRQGYDYSPKWESGNFDIEVSNDGLYFVKWDKLIEKSKIKANEIEEFIIDKNEKLPEIRVSSISDYKKYIPQKMKLKKSIFICYSHEDIRFKNDLKIYLATLLQKGLISIWDDAELRAGDDWNNKIRNYLTKADICILLVSQNLITSQYVNEVELKLILDNKAKDNCKIIPVLIRPCDWKNWEVYPDKITDDILSNSSANYSIGKFQFLPLNERRELKPVSRWSDTGDAWLQVANTVRDFCG